MPTWTARCEDTSSAHLSSLDALRLLARSVVAPRPPTHGFAPQHRQRRCRAV